MNDTPRQDNAAALQAFGRLLAALQRPGACGGFAGAATLRQTHISALLMAGDHVYKLKKPVALPFVDFSTLARREAACHEELRLNRRTAPQWYEAVVPVCQGPDGPCIAPPGGAAPGPVLEWALRMQRFDDSRLASRLARSGQLQPAQVDALAAVVASLHNGLPASPAGFGDPVALQAMVNKNSAELADLLAGLLAGMPPNPVPPPQGHPPEPLPAGLPPAAPQGPEQAAALRAAQQQVARWLAATGRALAPQMAQRRQAGLVRECHGDLHLANIVLDGNRPVLFDALEFDPALRHIDIAGDAAFAFMDLMAQAQDAPQGRRLAWRFASGWIEATGAHDALPLLRWWAVHRAAVRAKVALLSAPAAAGSQGRAEASAEAMRYLQVAQALASPAPAAPWLVMCCGLSGSGKSQVAQALAARLGGLRLRSDVERKRLHGLAPTDRGDAALYTPEAGARTYARLQALAAQALQAGVPVVVDAASLRAAERAAMRAVARACGARFGLLQCQAPLAVLAARVARRQQQGDDASDATPQLLARQQQGAQWPQPAEADRLWLLDTTPALAQVLAAVEALPLQDQPQAPGKALLGEPAAAVPGPARPPG